MNVKKLLVTALAIVMSLALSLGAMAQAEDRIITLSESWDFSKGIVPSLNPATSPNYGSIYWSRNFYNTLTTYDDSGEIVGELAKSWEISEDGQTYTFSLRDDVLFSDGAPFTAEAVKVSFEAAVHNLGDYNGSFGTVSALIDEMEIVDDHTIRIHLIQPYYAALHDFTMACPLGIINPAAFSGTDDLTYGPAFLSASYGSGPYMYAGDFGNNTYTFVRNPHYFGEAPQLDGFRVKVIEDNDAKLLALRSGEIDAILSASQISYDGFSELSSNPAFGAGVDDNAALTRYLAMNLTKAPFDDVRVRQAVAYAIDQEVLEKAVFNGLETAAETLFLKHLPRCDVEQTTYSTDLARAAALLDEAGWIDTDGDGVRERDGQKFEVDLHYMTSLATIDNLALAVSAQLAEVGIKVNVVAGDMMTYYAAMGTSPLLLASTYGGSFDPYTVLTNISPTVSTDPVAVQYAAILPEGIIDELNSTADMDRVDEIYQTVLTTIADQCLLVPLSYSHEMAIWNQEAMSGFSFSADGRYVTVAGVTCNESAR